MQRPVRYQEARQKLAVLSKQKINNFKNEEFNIKRYRVDNTKYEIFQTKK